mmetsp:Transcript_90862/g.236720  ORF Transcript_90862/g.236720 Transcript_90862/m.236720 type:complete len:248 (-) Transcript_90862:138-881(-)
MSTAVHCQHGGRGVHLHGGRRPVARGARNRCSLSWAQLAVRKHAEQRHVLQAILREGARFNAVFPVLVDASAEAREVARSHGHLGRLWQCAYRGLGSLSCVADEAGHRRPRRAHRELRDGDQVAGVLQLVARLRDAAVDDASRWRGRFPSTGDQHVQRAVAGQVASVAGRGRGVLAAEADHDDPLAAVAATAAVLLPAVLLHQLDVGRRRLVETNDAITVRNVHRARAMKTECTTSNGGNRLRWYAE